ncbi:MAG: hypothetical protein ACREA9_01940 [Pyrinomonadaceae bacterium]
MSDEEINKKMEFIVEQQAKFVAEIEIMRELQAADAKRLGDGLIGLVDIVGSLARFQIRTEETVNLLTQAQARSEERLDRLAQSQSRTDDRLNIFIAVVERFISGNGGAESSA